MAQTNENGDRKENLKRILAPRSVAIVGASPSKTRRNIKPSRHSSGLRATSGLADRHLTGTFIL